MATNQTEAAKAKTVENDMPSRRIFTTLEEMVAYLAAQSESLSDFGDYPFIAKGFDPETGEFDPAVYSDGMVPMVVKVTKRSEKTGEGSKVKAIVVTPIPTLEALIDSEQGREWVRAKVMTALNKAVADPLRDAEDPASVADQIPGTMNDFLTSESSNKSALGTFDSLYKELDALFKKLSAPWERARLRKADIKKSLESTAYALSVFPTLENRGEGRKSLFVQFLEAGEKAAVGRGLDPAIFRKWMDNRDKTSANLDDGDEDIDFDTEDLLAKLGQVAGSESSPTEDAPAAADEDATEDNTAGE